VWENGTGEAVASIEVRNYQACAAYYWDDWKGNLIFTGSNMTFPAGWYNIVDNCNPTRNTRDRVKGVTLQWFLTANNTTLDIITPFHLGHWNHFALTRTHY
jgi:hypothetical protein